MMSQIALSQRKEIERSWNVEFEARRNTNNIRHFNRRSVFFSKDLTKSLSLRVTQPSSVATKIGMSVMFYDAIIPPQQPIGVGISPYTLAYTCEGKTEAIEACVVSDSKHQADILKGDIFIGVNGEPLVNMVNVSAEVHYDAVISKLSKLSDKQRTIRFLRCSTECHDESVNAAIVVICPEEAALLFDPTHRDVSPEYDEVDFPPLSSSTSLPERMPLSSLGSATDALSRASPHSHPYYSSNQLEYEVQQEMQRLAVELRQAEEEDNRQIELEVQRQLVKLAAMGPPSTPITTAAANAIAGITGGATTNPTAYPLQSQEEATRRLLVEEERLNERRQDGQRNDDQRELTRRFEDERRELTRLQQDTKREAELLRERERESERRRAEEESRRALEMEYHRRMTMPPAPYMTPFYSPYGMPLPFAMPVGPMPTVPTVAAPASAHAAAGAPAGVAPAVTAAPVDDELRRHVALLEKRLAAFESEQSHPADAPLTESSASSHHPTPSQEPAPGDLEDLVSARIAQVEAKMLAELSVAQAAARRAEEEARRVGEILRSKEQALEAKSLEQQDLKGLEDSRRQTQARQQHQLWTEFLAAQEAAKRAEGDARGTAEALRVQEELLALRHERMAVEDERSRIEDEKNRALGEIDERMRLAREELEAERQRAVTEAAAREAELQVQSVYDRCRIGACALCICIVSLTVSLPLS